MTTSRFLPFLLVLLFVSFFAGPSARGQVIKSLEVISNGSGLLTESLGFTYTSPTTPFSFSADWFRDASTYASTLNQVYPVRSGYTQGGMMAGGGIYFISSFFSAGLANHQDLENRVNLDPGLVYENSYEIRFTAAGGLAHAAFTTGSIFAVPFEVWFLGDTPDDQSDDVRMVPRVLDPLANDQFSIGDHFGTSTGFPWDASDAIYFYMPLDISPGDAGYQAWAAGSDPLAVGPEHLRRIVLVDYENRQGMPETGSIFRITGADQPGSPAVTVAKSQVWIDATNDSDVTKGDQLQYSITITNTGTIDATGVHIVDPLHTLNAFVQGSVAAQPPTPVTLVGTTPIDIEVGTVQAGTSILVSFIVDITGPIPSGTVITNTATVTGDNFADQVTNQTQITPTPTGQTRWYVDCAAGSDVFNGLSFVIQNFPVGPFLTVQRALSMAVAGDEIWVRQGTCYPNAGLIPAPTDPRDATIQLKTGVALYGGFLGNESLLSDRDWRAHPTFIDGDIGTTGSGFSNNTDNIKHVFSGAGVDQSARIDGFIIKSGYAANSSGGGLLLPGPGGSPTIANVIFEYNGNGAVFMAGNSNPLFVNVTFRNNRIDNHLGGAVYVGSPSHPVFHNTLFHDNEASRGGSVYLDGMADFTNVTLTDNTADLGGGAFHITSNGVVKIENSIVWGNVSNSGAPNITNMNAPGATIQNSLIEGSGGSGSGWSPSFGIDFGGNIATDPQFNGSGTFTPIVGSPVADAGNNALIPLDLADINYDNDPNQALPLDLYGQPRVFGPAVSMGAVEVMTATDITPDDVLPGDTVLQQNYPNPFNPETRITFQLERPGPVTLAVFDILGREVARLVDSELPAGVHAVRFDGSNLSSGVFFYQLRTEKEVLTKTMSLLR